jgi:hypothetical protein
MKNLSLNKKLPKRESKGQVPGEGAKEGDLDWRSKEPDIYIPMRGINLYFRIILPPPDLNCYHFFH